MDTAVDTMLFGFRRKTKWLGLTKQTNSLTGFGILEKDIHPKSETADWVEGRDWMIEKLARVSADDRIGVARLFVLANARKDLRGVITRAHARNVFFVETDTGRMTNDLDHLLEMFDDAGDAYAGRWLSPERAAELGAMGAKESPVTKRRKGLMPHGQVQRILNDHKTYKTLAAALKAINSDKRYSAPWSRERIYREWRLGHLKLIPRVKGHAAL